MTPTPGSKRQKNAFFLHSSNILGVYEVNVGYKTTKGDIHPLSASKQNAQVKVSFGPPVSCEFQERKVDGEIIKEFKLVNNRRQSVALKDTLLNNLEFIVNDFSRKITAMVIEDKKKLLALYLSKINQSESFVHHRDEIHDSCGFELSSGEGSGQDIVDAGGSVEEFKQFVKVAKESAHMVESADKAVGELVKNKNSSQKRRMEGPVKPPKLSKVEIVEANEKIELIADDGLENAYQASFVGVAHIPIDKISVSPEMQVKVNPFRVQFIVSSMRKRYDPAISVLVVCPVEERGQKTVKDQNYYVVQKIHCLQAFKELDKSGEFEKMAGHINRQTLAYILNTNSPDLMQYGHARENFISGQFARKTSPMDLLHTFKCLTMKDSSVKALKVVDRMAKLCCIGPDECTALGKICQWSSGGFARLMEVLDQFEKYGTNDAKKSGNQQRIARGEKLNLPNVLLRLLAKCSEAYFLANCRQVLDNLISLKDLADNFKLVTDVDKVYKVFSVIAESENVGALIEKYPGKFGFEQMKQFVGAVGMGSVRNMKAALLQNYYESVVSTPEEVVDNPVEFFPYETVQTVFEAADVMSNYDLVILNMKHMNKDICMNIIGAILGGDKFFHAAVFVFPSELDHFEVLSFLRSQQTITSLIKDFKVVPLLFKNDVKNAEEVNENVKYALLFGKLSILNAPLHVHYSDLVQLSNVVESICPPRVKVALISDPGVSGIKLHSEDFNKKVAYFGAQSDINKFKKKLDADKTTVGNQVDAMDAFVEEDNNVTGGIQATQDTLDSEASVSLLAETVYSDASLSLCTPQRPQCTLDTGPEDVPSTSTTPTTTPIKSPAIRFDDSGYLGGQDQSFRSLNAVLSENDDDFV